MFLDFDYFLILDFIKLNIIFLELEYMIVFGDSGGGLFINGYFVGVNFFGWGLKDGWNNFSYYDVVGFICILLYFNWIYGVIWVMEILRIDDVLNNFIMSGYEFKDNLILVILE